MGEVVRVHLLPFKKGGSYLKINFNGDIGKVTKFVTTCATFSEDIDVKAGRYIVDGKSLLGMCAISTMPDIEVDILTDDGFRIAVFQEIMKEFA